MWKIFRKKGKNDETNEKAKKRMKPNEKAGMYTILAFFAFGMMFAWIFGIGVGNTACYDFVGVDRKDVIGDIYKDRGETYRNTMTGKIHQPTEKTYTDIELNKEIMLFDNNKKEIKDDEYI